MITHVRLENFKGHHDTSLALERFTVLVGDNGSGKTSVLEAFQFPKLVEVRALSPGEFIRHNTPSMKLSFDGQQQGRPWSASITLTAGDRRLRAWGKDNEGKAFDGAGTWGAHTAAVRKIEPLRGRVDLYRLRADQIAAGAYSEQPGAMVAEDGALTAVVLAAMKLADDEAFDRIETAMGKIVPSLKRVLLRPATVQHPSNPNPVTGSKLYFDFQGAKGVPAHHASQGTLIALALLTVLHQAERPRVILLDDFDHALHPRAQMELVRMIKELLALDELQDTQVLATTHSPYVLDELPLSSIVAFALRDDGSVAAKSLAEHPDAKSTTGTLKSGELWTLDGERSWVL